MRGSADAAERAGAASPREAARSRTASGPAIADYLRARLAELKGDVPGAVEALRLAVEHDPSSPQLRSSYAEALARAGRLDAAEAEARRAVALAPPGPASTDAHLVLGKVLSATGRVSEAIRELEAAAASEGGPRRAPATPPWAPAPRFDPEPWRLLARLRFQAGDRDGAAAAAEDLAAVDRRAAAESFRELGIRLHDAKDEPGAARQLRRAVELAPSDGDAWRVLAQVEEAQQRLPEAREAWQRALRADPDDPEVLLSLGQLALRRGDVEEGRAWFRQLLRVAPDEALVKVRVAAAWLDAKRAADALEVAAGSDAAELSYLRGVALLQLRRWSEASVELEKVGPDRGEIYVHARAGLAVALSRSGRAQDAVAAVRRGLDAQPKNPVLLFALGEAYDRAGDRDAALAQMRAVLAAKPDHAEALNYLGYSYADRGERLAEAQELIERALGIDPDNAAFLDSLGWVLFKRGDVPGAVRALEKASALSGPEPTVLEHLGDAYRAADRFADAAEAYRRALDVVDLADDEPGVTPVTRRAAVKRKLDELGPRGVRSTTTRR